MGIMERNVSIEIPQGLGDAVYCYPILKELILTRYKGYGVYIHHNPYKIIFDPLKKFGNILGHHVTGAEKLKLHYRSRRFADTTQYEDLVISAGLPHPVSFILDWEQNFTQDFLRENARKIKAPYLIVAEPRAAHMHKNFNMVSVDPAPEGMQEHIDHYRKDFFIIAVGKGEKFSARLKNIDLDLVDKIEYLQDYINLVKYSSIVLTPVNHLVPFAQAFRKRHRIFYPVHPKFDYIRPEKFDTLFSKNYDWRNVNVTNN